MKKFTTFVGKLITFATSPQGKRDIALIVAAGSALADLLKHTGVI